MLTRESDSIITIIIIKTQDIGQITFFLQSEKA